jgi:L-ascorbate metabolism protein UlaG (beta-lactamase superfamily)
MKTSIIIIAILINLFNIGCTWFHEIKPASINRNNFPSGENSITYIGHATVLIHLDNINIITDPVFGNYTSGIFKRYVEPGIKFENLPPIHAILITHEHNDHLDNPTLRRFSKIIPVIISKGLGKRISRLGFSDVRELEMWQTAKIEALRITATPAKHIFSKSMNFVIEGSRI